MPSLGDYFARTGSPALSGITFALTVHPDLLGGPLLAQLADRYPRRTVRWLPISSERCWWPWRS